MEQREAISEEYGEETQLRDQVEQSEHVMAVLQKDLRQIDHELDELAKRTHQYDMVSEICASLEKLEEIGAADLFWDQAGEQDPSDRLRYAKNKIEKFGEEIAEVEYRRQSVLKKITDQNSELDYLHYDLQDAVEREENRRSEWVVQRAANDPQYHEQVMPWARGCEEDERYRKTLRGSILLCLLLGVLISLVDLPVPDLATLQKVPDRVANLVREELPPPPKVEAPVIPEKVTEPEPEPEPELAENVQEEIEFFPENTVEPTVADVEQPDTKEQVRTKGILAFRDSFASRATARPTAQLGSQARVSSAGEEAVGRPERAMVTTSAPGSSGGINLSSISRDVGGGGPGIEGVAVSRVASSIGGAEGPDRPLSAGAFAGRTDEEIQIVFDRYKAALYRLYNRELRRDPTLRGQMVLRLTIEPDGSVSMCEVQSSDMKAPLLSDQVVDRVRDFDFGAKDGIVAMTIIYPIDFLPAS